MGAHEAKRAGRGHEKTRTSALVCAEAYTHEAHTRRSGQGARSRVQGMHTGRRQVARLARAWAAEVAACMGSRGGGVYGQPRWRRGAGPARRCRACRRGCRRPSTAWRPTPAAAARRCPRHRPPITRRQPPPALRLLLASTAPRSTGRAGPRAAHGDGRRRSSVHPAQGRGERSTLARQAESKGIQTRHVPWPAWMQDT